MTNIDALKALNPIVAVAERYGLQLQPSGQNYRALCPFHDDHNPSFYLYPETGTFKCFGAGCGLYGDVIDFVGYQIYGLGWHKKDSVQFRTVLLQLEGEGKPGPVHHAGPPPSPDKPHKIIPSSSEKRPSKAVLNALDLAARIYHEHLLTLGDCADSPLRYLYQRGLTWKTIRQGQFGYCPSHSNLLQNAAELMDVPRAALLESGLLQPKRRGSGFYETFYTRVTLTERDTSYRVVHLIGRKFPDEGLPREAPKYLSLPGWPKPLYGFASLRRRSSDPVFIVEAPMDMLTLKQWGYEAVAVTGADLKREHAARLRMLNRHLVIIPNNDQAGELAVKRWSETLGSDVRIKVLHLPKTVDGKLVKDVNDLAQVEIGETIFRDLLRKRLLLSGEG